MPFNKKTNHFLHILIFFYAFVSCEVIALPETSGLVFVEERDLFYSVGDEGFIYEIDSDLEISRSVYLGSYDLEAIAYDGSGFFYCLDENNMNVLVIDSDTFEQLRIIKPKISKKHKKEYYQYESLIYIEEEDLFYFAVTNVNDDGGALFSFSGSDGEVEKALDLDMVDVSGLAYHEGSFYMVSDRENSVTRYNPLNQSFITFSVPGDNQEGIAVKPSGELYIIEENGKIHFTHIKLFEKSDQ